MAKKRTASSLDTPVYHLTTSSLIASEEQTQYAGQSTVSITCTKDLFSKVISQTWVHDVASAMTVFFDCKAYSTALTRSIEWTFYGIAPNTVAAAIAFEMAHNLILEWARGKKGTINSYCLGVAAGLREMASENKKEEREAKRSEQETLSARINQEQLERQKELGRLNGDVDMPHAVHVADDIIQHGATVGRNSSNNDESSIDSDDEMGHVVFNNQAEEEMEAEPTFKVEKDTLMDPEADFEAELKRILKERPSTPLTKIKSKSSSPQPKIDEGLSGLEDVKQKLEEEFIKSPSRAREALAARSQWDDLTPSRGIRCQ